MQISNNQVSSAMAIPKKLEIRKTAKTLKTEKIKHNTMKLSQIRQRRELCMREIVLRFEMNLSNSYSKQILK
jgi:hypothetical protein